MNYKMVILVRTDLKMDRGKIAAQVGHGVLGAYKKAKKENPYQVKAWELIGQQKVVLKVSSLKELTKYFMIAKRRDLPTVMIADAGRTQIKAGSKTVCAIGPAPEDKIDEITGELKLL